MVSWDVYLAGDDPGPTASPETLGVGSLAGSQARWGWVGFLGGGWVGCFFLVSFVGIYII